MKFLHRLRDTYMRTSEHTFPRMTKVYDHCPHCNRKTPWMARALSGFARCLQCGKDPLTHDADSAGHADSVEHVDDADPSRVAA